MRGEQTTRGAAVGRRWSSWRRLYLGCLIASAFTTATGSDGPQLVTEIRDWGVYRYADGGSERCFLASRPIARRGPSEDWEASWMLVSTDASAGPSYSVSFSLDRTLDPERGVRMLIGERAFELIVDGDTAWAADARTDLRVVVAMKRGRRMVVSAGTTEGETVLDSFSLMGFSDALNAATKGCRGP